jgi:hypothetical protein
MEIEYEKIDNKSQVKISFLISNSIPILSFLTFG